MAGMRMPSGRRGGAPRPAAGPSRWTGHRPRTRHDVAADAPAPMGAASAPGRLVRLPWPLVAALAAVATAAVGVLPPVVLAVLGWVEATDVSLWNALALGVRGWLLAHGAPATAGALHITIVPLGVTLLIAVVAAASSGWAARLARVDADVELSQHDRRSLAARVAGVFALAYVVCVLVASAVADGTHQPGRAVLGGLVLSGASALVGAGRALGWHPTAWWPAWLRAVPRAVGAALAVQVGAGALAGLVALLTHRSQVVALHESLHPGTTGGIVLVLLQLAWLPNLVLWCSSWALGAGFRLGSGTIVSPAWNLTAMMPAIPVLGAVGPNGPGRWYALLWLLSGVLAGTAAAWVVVRAVVDRATTAVRADETSLVGGLAGALAGLCLVVLAWLGNGDLGTGRLAELGSRLAPLAVMAPTVMGLSGLVAGLVMGLVHRRPADDVDTDGATAGEGDGTEDEADEKDADGAGEAVDPDEETRVITPSAD